MELSVQDTTAGYGFNPVCIDHKGVGIFLSKAAVTVGHTFKIQVSEHALVAIPTDLARILKIKESFTAVHFSKLFRDCMEHVLNNTFRFERKESNQEPGHLIGLALHEMMASVTSFI